MKKKLFEQKGAGVYITKTVLQSAIEQEVDDISFQDAGMAVEILEILSQHLGKSVPMTESAHIILQLRFANRGS